MKKFNNFNNMKKQNSIQQGDLFNKAFQFYNYIQAKRDSGEAIVATVKKLLESTYQILKNESIFESFPNFVLEGCINS